MIRVSLPVVKQAPKRSASPGHRSLALLPPAGGPQITRSSGGEVDALLVIVPQSAAPASLDPLPESRRWRDPLAREPPRAGAVRTTSLANRRQTLAVLGFLEPEPSANERPAAGIAHLECRPGRKRGGAPDLTLVATRFLSRFVPEEIPWAHVDLSSATRTGGLGHINTDVTGFGVRFAMQLILHEGILEGLERRK